MKDQILLMARWQGLKNETEALERRIGALPDKIALLDQELAAREEEAAAAEDAISRMKKAYRELDRNARDLLARIKGKEARLPSVKTNKEYQAILKEMDAGKAENSRMEDRMLEMLDEIETAETTAGHIRSATAIVRERVARDREEIASEQRRLITERDAVLRRFSEVDEELEASLKEKIGAVMARCKTPAVVPVRNSVCFGCHMNIPRQLYNELQLYENLKYCPFCSRILYWDPVGEPDSSS